MDRKLLSEDELDRLLGNRAALHDQSVDAALDGVWRHIVSSGVREAPSRAGSRPLYRRRWAVAGAAVAVAGVASLVGVEGLTGGAGGGGLPLAVSPAAAAQLNRVADAAGAAGLTARQWDYVEVTEPRQDHPTETVRVQEWSSADGTSRELVTSDDGTVLSDTVVQPNPLPAGVDASSPPSDPQALLADISAAAHARGIDPNPDYLWASLQGVLEESTSAQLRSTAFAALKYVPGTQVLGDRTDSLGRSGTAISFTDVLPSTATVKRTDERDTMIASPSTGEILDYSSRHPAAGPVTGRMTFTHQGVVDSDTALPGGGIQPLPTSASTTTSTTPAASTSPDSSTATR